MGIPYKDQAYKGVPGGAQANTRHGKHRSPEQRAWIAMRQRCLNTSYIQYPDYGGRGIDISERWSSFENFYEDMGERPSREHSLERLDNNKGYGPHNCKWATRKEQSANKRTSIFVDINEERTLLADAMRALRIMPHGLYYRLQKFGETYQEAVTHYAKLRGVHRGT